MAIRIVFTGTSSATPARDRNFPGFALVREGATYLFDCGEGTQRQLLNLGINPFKINAIFLTHMHGDHVLGLPGLVRTLGLNRRTQELNIYLPRGQESMIKSLVLYDRPKFTYPLKINGVAPGIVLQAKDFTVTAFKVEHSIATFGYAFQEKDRLKFLEGKCRKLGIRGEAFRRLLERKKIRVNGKDIKLGEVTYTKPGRRIVYITDAYPSQGLVRICRNADLLIHEATYLSADAETARVNMHSTALGCARMAKRAGVKRLIMTHLSARYKTQEAIVKEARSVFKKAEFAKDGMEVTI